LTKISVAFTRNHNTGQAVIQGFAVVQFASAVSHVRPAWGPLPLSRTHTPRPHTPHTCLTNVGRAQSKSPSAISIAERCACLTLGDSADAALARTGRRECGVFIAEYAAFLPLCPPLLFGLQRAATTSLPRCLATSHLLLLSLLPSQLQRLQMIGFIIQVIQVRVLSQIACLAARREAPLAFSVSYWWSNNRCLCCVAHQDLVCAKAGSAAWAALCQEAGLPTTLELQVAYEDEKFYALVVAGAKVRGLS